jgi:hypothetical protein
MYLGSKVSSMHIHDAAKCGMEPIPNWINISGSKIIVSCIFTMLQNVEWVSLHKGIWVQRLAPCIFIYLQDVSMHAIGCLYAVLRLGYQLMAM